MMGAKDQIGFVRVIPAECLTFAHKVRLEVCVASDGTFPGHTGPSHQWVDLHSTRDPETGEWTRLDVPITPQDEAAIRMIQRVCQMAEWPGASADKIGQALDAITRIAWGDDIAERIVWAATCGDPSPTGWPFMVDTLLPLEAAKGLACGVTP